MNTIQDIEERINQVRNRHIQAEILNMESSVILLKIMDNLIQAYLKDMDTLFKQNERLRETIDCLNKQIRELIHENSKFYTKNNCEKGDSDDE